MKDFEVILHQCKTQARKLCSIEMNDEYASEIDVFNNYFSQLQQILDNNEELHSNAEIDKLLCLIQEVIKRIQDKQESVSEQINSLKKNKNMVGYGAVKHQFAHRINRRY